jgi:phage terminase large subunit GpA-like protein
MDEVDKFTEATETEAPAINLAIERTNTYFNRKIFMASTPTVSGSAIHRAFLSGDQRYYQVSCPRCKEFQKLVFDGLKWGEDLKINGGWDYDAVKATAYYQCQRCEKPIHSYQKHQLLSTGIWVPEGKAGSHRSYHLSALYSPFLSFGDFAVEFLRSKKDLGSYRNFYNSWRGEIWQEISQSASTSQILDHKLQYPEGICPENPLAVIMTADLGKHQIWYVIRAWCHNETSYLLRYGSVPNMAALNDVARSVFKSPSGDVVVTHKLIDSGYETDEVYKFCRETGFIPVKGLQSASQPTSWSKVDSYDGMNRCLVDTTAYKDSIQRKLLITPGDPGSWNLHETTNELYSSHLTAEIAVEQTNAYGVPKRIWKRIRAANHLLDCEVYNFAAASVLNIKFQAAPVPVVIHRSEQKQKKSPSTQRTFNRPDGRTFWEIR